MSERLPSQDDQVEVDDGALALTVAALAVGGDLAGDLVAVFLLLLVKSCKAERRKAVLGALAGVLVRGATSGVCKISSRAYGELGEGLRFDSVEAEAGGACWSEKTLSFKLEDMARRPRAGVLSKCIEAFRVKVRLDSVDVGGTGR